MEEKENKKMLLFKVVEGIYEKVRSKALERSP